MRPANFVNLITFFCIALHRKSEPLIEAEQQLSPVTCLHIFSILSAQQVFLSVLLSTSVPWTFNNHFTWLILHSR